jgi:hypothetical protein
VIETKQTIIKLIFYLKTLVEVYYREIFVRLEEAIKITRKRKRKKIPVRKALFYYKSSLV